MSQLKPTHKYDDIIHLSRPVSVRHAPMPMADRGAQFSPFAALTGYDDVIVETGRLTDRQTVLAEGAEAELDEKLRQLEARLPDRPTVIITYFQPDYRKAGGSYPAAVGAVKKIDQCHRVILMTDGREIPMDLLYDMSLPEESAYPLTDLDGK